MWYVPGAVLPVPSFSIISHVQVLLTFSHSAILAPCPLWLFTLLLVHIYLQNIRFYFLFYRWFLCLPRFTAEWAECLFLVCLFAWGIFDLTSIRAGNTLPPGHNLAALSGNVIPFCGISTVQVFQISRVALAYIFSQPWLFCSLSNFMSSPRFF